MARAECKVEGCCRESSGLGYCNMHYQRFIKHGNTDCLKPAAKKWTLEEDNFLRENYNKGAKYCSEILGKTESSVFHRAKRICVKTKRFLSEEEKELFFENPNFDNQKIGKMFKRNADSVRHMRYNYGVGTIIDENFDKLTCAEVARLCGVHKTTVSRRWCDTYGLRFSKIGKQYKMIRINNLLKWMQANPERWDATKCEYHFFSKYKWFQEKKKQDALRMRQKRWGDFYEVV